jgi:hydrogenase-4 component B
MIFDSTLAPDLFFASLACFAAGALGALLAARSANLSCLVGHGAAILGATAALALAMVGLGGGSMRVVLPEVLPLGSAAFGIDRLSAVFVSVIAAGAMTAAWYAIGYTREYAGKHSVAMMAFAFNVFIAAMVLVVLARNVLTFLALWEIMSLASYFLLVTEHEREETVRAGWIYLVMTHAGFGALLVGFLLFADAAGSMEFAGWRIGAAEIDAGSRNLIFVLLAAGFASKAGAIPLHIWLPRAHPAAPSHVSALMSGVMIKLGIYGLARVAFDWLSAGPAWWGGAILFVGAVSALLGAMYAMIEVDLKRLLAHSSVENIGIILIGMGAAMLFHSAGLPGLAALSLVAALYHTLNHAAFKGLLFMAAGAVAQSARTRNLEELGGLIRRMPQTAALFLVGSLAIAALPPLNGFISEWLIFQSLLLSFQIPAQTVNLLFTLGVTALALTSGLAAACFVRAFGITFLALPRAESAASAVEVQGSMRAAMALLALVCVALGVAPFAVLTPLDATAFELIRARADMKFDWSAVAANGGFGWVAPFGVACGLLGLLLLLALGLRLLRANVACRFYETWGCGRALQTARFEYTATAFANPFKRVFELLYRSINRLEVQFHPDSRYFVRDLVYRHEHGWIFEDFLYRPLLGFIQAVARRARVLQSGSVHGYLVYILIALVALLLLAV